MKSALMRLQRYIAAILSLGCLLLVSACATHPASSAAGVDGEVCRLCALEAWTLEGRVAVQSAQQGWNANLHWEHDHRQDRVRISGPFSQGAVSVILQDDLIYINEGNGKTEVSREPDRALQAHVGFPVPLRSLRYWLLGVPSPQTEYVAIGKAGAGFVQQGWTLAYSGTYQADNFTLPARMVANGENAKLKLVLDSWAAGK